MSHSTALVRSLVIFGIVLPLAVLLGYMAVKLGEPRPDFSSLVTVGIVAGVLCLPLLLHWHHQLLFMGWNAVAVVFFLPGRPELWMFMALASFTIIAVQRALSSEIQMNPVPWMLAPLLFILAVVIGTAYLNGGIHLGSLGGDTLGGRKYLYLITGVLGFIAMTSLRIPEKRAGFYVGAYFLGGLTNLAGHAVALCGSWLTFILVIFPAQRGSEVVGTGDEVLGLNAAPVARDFGLSYASMAALFFLLARYGLKNILSDGVFKKLFFLLFIAGSIWGGFRSFLILVLMTCCFVFWFEGLFRTRFVLIPLAALLVLGGLAPFANKLPDPIQRSLSFLPVNVSPQVRIEAENSTLWRVKMWEKLLPEVPRYFWLGKGFEANVQEFITTINFQSRNMGGDSDAQMMSGDYHNGPLSILIPFGVWGMIGWVWFLGAGVRLLYLNYRYGKPQFQTANNLLLALFLARIILYFFVFGGFQGDLAIFAGLVALSICLNGGVGRPAKAPALPARQRKPKLDQPIRFAPGLPR